MEGKTSLRKDMRKILVNLDHRWVEAASAEICKWSRTLFRESFEGGGALCAWIPSFAGEQDLAALIAEELRHRPVYLPKSPKVGPMRFIRIQEGWGERLEVGETKVFEPIEGSGEELDPVRDLIPTPIVLVPGLAFDREGRRLGRGKGHYDRFLARVGPQNVVKVGVCWELQLVDRVPVGEYDVHMDWIVHERGVVRTVA